MERYHVFTTWGYEVCKPGFDTLSKAVEKACEVFSFTFMLGGEEMVLYVECHDGERKRRVAMVLHTGKVVMIDDEEE